MNEISFNKDDIWDAANGVIAACGANPGYLTEDERQLEYFYKEGEFPGKNQPAGVVMRNGDSITIAYRGTVSDISEIGNDLNAQRSSLRLDNGESVKVHAGFLNEYNKSEKAMREAVAKLGGNEPNIKLKVAGHSMGGALAQIHAIKEKSKRPQSSIECYTFGGPRVFSNDSVGIYNKLLGQSTLRIKNRSDPVPHLPSNPPYGHVGLNITLRSDVSRHLIDGYFDILKKLPNNISPAYIKENSGRRAKINAVNKELIDERFERLKKGLQELSKGNVAGAAVVISNTKKLNELRQKKNQIVR